MELMSTQGQNTPLMCTTLFRKYEVIILLIENGADVNASAKGQITPLMCAAQHSNYEVTRLLIENEANVKQRS